MGTPPFYGLWSNPQAFPLRADTLPPGQARLDNSQSNCVTLASELVYVTKNAVRPSVPKDISSKCLLFQIKKCNLINSHACLQNIY